MASPELIEPRNWVVGFRFHPTDYELTNYFLRRKISGHGDNGMQIPDIKVCDYEPWDIPGLMNSNSEDQVWYFFCPRDYKYLRSSRSNRTTKVGYWKPTGKPRKVKDKHKKKEIGTKRSLVFYKKDSPKATRTKWIMHEYDIQGNFVLCKLKFKPDAEKALIVAASNAASPSDIESLKLTEMTSNSSCDECEPSIVVASPNEMTAMSTYVNDKLISSPTRDFENQNPNKVNDISVSDGGEWSFLAPTSPDSGNQNQRENTDMSTSSIVSNLDNNASENTPLEVDLQDCFKKLEALLELEEDNRFISAFFQPTSRSESGSYTTSFDASVFGGVGSEMEWANEDGVYWPCTCTGASVF
ncbi:hypothetical protein JCGZ_14162 [Jatropha curcas]|uniref:NAC transcription factor 072 n=2 Tax=Jatropha curcas TaxID=180498 RepID=R4N7S4_JATCU|nr:NAC transcription factor 072 [Jatropha curcas]KDP28391.1 hypothetical protein JCGZ_14162 [Jatropha curcas]